MRRLQNFTQTLSLLALMFFTVKSQAQVNLRTQTLASTQAITFTDQHPADDVQDPQALVKAIGRGLPPEWQESIQQASHRTKTPLLNPHKSYVLIMATEPTHAFDFRSGEHLRRSMTQQAPGIKTKVGHMMLGWQCSNGTAIRRQGFAAVSGEYDNQVIQMVNSGWGLTPYISTFTDGQLQTIETFSHFYKKTYYPRRLKFSFLALEVSGDQCEKVNSFVETYAVHKNRPYRIFGSVPSPGRFEGAGCLSFVNAALDHANILRGLRSQYVRQVRVPFRLLGRGPLNQDGQPKDLPHVFVAPEILNQAKREISLDSLFKMSWDPQGEEPYFIMDQQDPELVHLGFRMIKQKALQILESRLRPTFSPREWKPIEDSLMQMQIRDMQPRVIESLNLYVNPLVPRDDEASASHYKSETIEPGYDRENGNQSSTMQTQINQLFESGVGVEFFNFLYGYGLKLEFSHLDGV